MRLFIGLGIAMIASIPAAALAQEQTGYAQIATGQYRQAEQTLIAQRQAFPDSPELMLNLAAVYLKTSRTAEATALYNSVLAQPDVLMDISEDRTAWSHAIARTGLRRAGGVQLSSR